MCKKGGETILDSDDGPHLCSSENTTENQEDCGDSRCNHVGRFTF